LTLDEQTEATSRARQSPDGAELASLRAQAEEQLAALEPAKTLDWTGLSTPELDELSAADSPEAVAEIEERIRQRISSRQEQRHMKPRKEQATT
jgi:hypothetical protein